MSEISKPIKESKIHDSKDIQCHEPIIVRLHRALGPLAGGIILDTVDLMTFGPIGLFGGLVIGFAAGWWVSSIYEYSYQARINWALLAGLYCMIPFTAIIPIATLVSAVGRFRERKRSNVDKKK